MNNILQKVLAELRAPEPRLDYVIGMLETLIELRDGEAQAKVSTPRAEKVQPVEVESIETAALASLETIKKMSEEASKT